jgi:hypothetical protein
VIEAVAFTFDAAKHEYKMNGNPVPACTRVLNEGGLVAYRFVTEEILERRSELGREVHRACHLHNVGKLGQYDARVKPHLHAWIGFKEQTGFVPLESEFQCIGYVNGMAFGMQIDCAGMLGEDEAIVDYKIGKIYPHHGVQLAAYAAGYPHKKLSTPFARFLARKRIGVELCANGRPKIHEFDHKSDFEVFASLLYVTNWKRRHERTYRGETT